VNKCDLPCGSSSVQFQNVIGLLSLPVKLRQAQHNKENMMKNTTLMFMGSALVLTFSAGTTLAAADTAAGEAVFKKCRACHSVIEGKKKIGPSLYGVVGRKPASVEGYKYSASMQAFGATGAVWDAATLNTYLTKPRALVTKTKMMFPGLPNEADRTALIAYLDSLDG
jgi:cytochrome c